MNSYVGSCLRSIHKKYSQTNDYVQQESWNKKTSNLRRLESDSWRDCLLIHSPSSSRTYRYDKELGPNWFKFGMTKGFCEYVNHQIIAGNMHQSNQSSRHLFPNKMNIDLNVFYFLIQNWIIGHTQCTDVVKVCRNQEFISNALH